VSFFALMMNVNQKLYSMINFCLIGWGVIKHYVISPPVKR